MDTAYWKESVGKSPSPVCRADLLIYLLRPDSGVLFHESSPEFFLLYPINVQYILSLFGIYSCVPCPHSPFVLSREQYLFCLRLLLLVYFMHPLPWPAYVF